ncbi:MAG: response regulator [Pseudolabrys sp.]|nr:response regulator [Pseudolabrys sp.]
MSMTETAEATHRAPKMLIADDDPAIVRLLTDRCVKMGFSVEVVTNGMQLMIKARHNPPDVLMVDVNMPELDGLSACTRLLDPGGKPVEVVVITGSADPETVERCESMGLYYAHKGPKFWASVEAALGEIFPAMTAKIRDHAAQPPGVEMRDRPRVLIVDDDPAMGTFLASRFGKFRVETLHAANAAAGYRMACKYEPTVIVCDNFMPNGDALYLLHRLRQTALTARIPVIVVSGRHLDEVSVQHLKREISGHPGAAMVLVKSLDPTELFNAVQKYCYFEKSHAVA